MNDAGTVIVADVYAAGEAPIEGVNRDALVEGLRARGHRSVVPLPWPAQLAEMVNAIARAGDSWCASAPAPSRNGPPRCPAQLAALQAARPAHERSQMRGGSGSGTGPPSSRLLDPLPPLRGRVQAQRAAGADHLVPRRRPGRGAGAARRCR